MCVACALLPGPALVFFLNCLQLEVMPITPRAGQGAPGITGIAIWVGSGDLNLGPPTVQQVLYLLSQLLSCLPVFLEELLNPMIEITTSLLVSFSKTSRKTLLFRDFKCLFYSDRVSLLSRLA